MCVCVCVDWIYLDQNIIQWLAFVKHGLKLRIPKKKSGKFVDQLSDW